ncbi:MAG TPA: NAD(P)-dependent oxidoreductase [bacterium]|nr:NAD(P)-dependent oxidoreductase [bacterium]
MSGLSMITGGSGMLGRELANRLASLGRPARLFDVVPPRTMPEGAEYVKGDLRKPSDTDPACVGVSVIYHLAALDATASGDEIRAVNIEGTASLIESAAIAGVQRIVFASSSDVYGSPPPESPCHEESPLVSTGPFSMSKIAGEELCLSAAAGTDMKASVIRMPIVIGPGLKDPHIMRWIVNRAVEHKPIFLGAGGSAVRHYADCGDCADAFIAAADNDVAAGHCFNVGYDRPHTDEEFARAVVRAAKSFSIIVPAPRAVSDAALRIARAAGEDPVPADYRDGVFGDSWLATDKARALLGWRPQKRLPVSLHDFMRWHKRNLLKNLG